MAGWMVGWLDGWVRRWGSEAGVGNVERPGPPPKAPIAALHSPGCGCCNGRTDVHLCFSLCPARLHRCRSSRRRHCQGPGAPISSQPAPAPAPARGTARLCLTWASLPTSPCGSTSAGGSGPGARGHGVWRPWGLGGRAARKGVARGGDDVVVQGGAEAWHSLFWCCVGVQHSFRDMNAVKCIPAPHLRVHA